MPLDEFCSGELCERAFDLLAVGAPSVIALFLIIYAHRTLSARLKEASAAGQIENAEAYRTQFNRVWTVALFLLIVHAGVFVWARFGLDRGAEAGFVTGTFDEFEDGSIQLESRPDRLYFRVGFGSSSRWPWIITGAQQMKRETFVIDIEGGQLICPVDLTGLDREDGEIELRLDRDDTQAPTAYKIILLPRRHNITWSCEIERDNVPPGQLPHGGPLDVFDATGPGEGAGEEATHGWLGPFLGFGRAHAGIRLSDIDRTIGDLNDNDYRIRLDARQVIAKDFEPYREWAEYVARDEAAFQAGNSKYGRPSYRSRLGLVYALSRRHPLPREDMFEPVDLPPEIIDFAIEQGLSEDEHLRAAAKRFVITYPGPDMVWRLHEVSDGVEAAAAERQAWARDLLAHFYYNRGVLIVLALRDSKSAAPEPDQALDAFATADYFARELPPEMQLEYAKIDYGLGWTLAVGAQEGFGDEFTEESAQEAFRAARDQIGNRENEYPYQWQLPLIDSYIQKPDYGLFNK